jgi:predicted HTH domain antitoxin
VKIEVVVPDELLTTLQQEPESFRHQILLHTLGSLYEAGRISGGLGARVMGCNRWEFYRLLSEHGFAVIDYPDEELDREAEVGQVWSEQVQTP